MSLYLTVGTVGTGAIVLLGETRLITLGVFQYALIPVRFSVRAADRIIDLVAKFSASWNFDTDELKHQWRSICELSQWE